MPRRGLQLPSVKGVVAWAHALCVFTIMNQALWPNILFSLKPPGEWISLTLRFPSTFPSSHVRDNTGVCQSRSRVPVDLLRFALQSCRWARQMVAWFGPTAGTSEDRPTTMMDRWTSHGRGAAGVADGKQGLWLASWHEGSGRLTGPTANNNICLIRSGLQDWPELVTHVWSWLSSLWRHQMG